MPLTWTESGSPSSQALVFLHGAGLSAKQWAPQLSAFPEFHLLAPDLPGNGQSPGPFDMDLAVEALADTIRTRTTLGKASLVGSSLGGAVALALLRRYPERVERVLMSGTSGQLSPFLAWVMEGSGFLYRFPMPEWLISSSLKQLGVPSNRLADFREDLRRVMTPEANRQIASALRSFEPPREAAVPVWVAVGSRETLPAKRAARELARVIPTATGLCVPGGGHVWNLETPERFNELVRAWMGDRPLPDAFEPL